MVRSPRRRAVASSVRSAASRMRASELSSNFFRTWGGVMQLMQRQWFEIMENLHLTKITEAKNGNLGRVTLAAIIYRR
jgi:hypothetical protein